MAGDSFPATTTAGTRATFQKRRHSRGASWSWPPSFWRLELLLQIIQPIRNASAGSGNAAVLRLGRRSFRNRSLLGVNETGQGQNCQSAGEYHTMNKKRTFHHLCKGKTGMNLIQTYLFRLSLFSSVWDLQSFPDSVFSGKNIPGQFFCRKSLHARFGNDNFSPSSTGRTKTKVKGVLAQLVERFNGIEEVSGSNPLCSTK